MINRTVLVGRLTKDPELRRTSNDIPVTSFTLAVNRPYANQSGEREADFIQCVVWRRQAENVEKFVSKGSLVGVEGRIQTRTYDDQDGNRRYVTEVVCDSVQFLEPKSVNENHQNNNDYSQSPSPSKPKSQPKPETNHADDLISEDDLPF